MFREPTETEPPRGVNGFPFGLFDRDLGSCVRVDVSTGTAAGGGLASMLTIRGSVAPATAPDANKAPATATLPRVPMLGFGTGGNGLSSLAWWTITSRAAMILMSSLGGA
jgi:hypothetical protein